MSADLLRRAATLLRERAEAATVGPWRRAADSVKATRHGFRANAIGNWDREYASQVSYHCTGDGAHADRDGAYIALMHPPVALVVAGWLDATATEVETFASQYAGEERDGDLTETDRAALAVARAILREEP